MVSTYRVGAVPALRTKNPLVEIPYRFESGLEHQAFEVITKALVIT